MKKKIAIFTTGWCCEILTQFLTGMQEALEKEPVDLFLFTCYPTHIDSTTNRIGELNIFKLPDLKKFDGVVIFGSGLDFKDEVDQILKRSKEAGIPVIMQGGKREGTYYVGSDNYVATLEMCKHLQEKHDVHDIVFLAGTDDSLDSELRLKAVRDYLEQAGRGDDLKEVFYTRWENAVVTKYIDEYCASGRPLPDVFICANDGLAMETCMSLFRNGHDVPRDVLVCGYDYIDDSQIFDPSIASVDQCISKMGAACGEMWIDLLSGKECEASMIIPCEFIPGDSCNCYEHRNSDKIRRRVRRDAFLKRATNTYFNRKLNLIDSTVLSSLSFPEFCSRLHDLLLENHTFEGDSFHILLDPNFGLSINDPNIYLGKNGYNKNMDILFSMEDGKEYDRKRFFSEDLVPGYKDDATNHLYTFLPLHEGDEAFGFIVFRDGMEKILNHYLQTYQSRMGLVFDKFRHSLSLDLINKRLLEVMKKDTLTNVSNRRAYEDKEIFLQSEINSGSGLRFAIAMFDVNNLKLINDSKGHEAGDEYLIKACRLICNVFKHSPVYRVGGDEFITVLTGEDFNNRETLIKEIEKRLSPYQSTLPIPEDYVSIACGLSEYDPEKDKSVQDVFKRADDLMYKNKAHIKGLE
jgi:diguanylate cyclase (GGDEF)-like protein